MTEVRLVLWSAPQEVSRLTFAAGQNSLQLVLRSEIWQKQPDSLKLATQEEEENVGDNESLESQRIQGHPKNGIAAVLQLVTGNKISS